MALRARIRVALLRLAKRLDAPTEPVAISHPAMQSFEDAFSGGGSGCRGTCVCGRQFYNSDGGWDWEEGELEALRANPDAVDLAWGVGRIEFEGCCYVWDCDCWKPRAVQIIKFILGHDSEIAAFLSAEKRRKQAAADRSPVPA